MALELETKAELEGFLHTIDHRFVAMYADDLWSGQIFNIGSIAAATPALLHDFGVRNGLHAAHIIERAKAAVARASTNSTSAATAGAASAQPDSTLAADIAALRAMVEEHERKRQEDERQRQEDERQREETAQGMSDSAMTSSLLQVRRRRGWEWHP